MRTLAFVAALAAGLCVASEASASLEVPKDVNALTDAQKDRAVEPYFNAANTCIKGVVAADAHFRSPNANLGDLTVDAVRLCAKEQRALSDAYEQYFGENVGGQFYNTYLDWLPQAIRVWGQRSSSSAQDGN